MKNIVSQKMSRGQGNELLNRLEAAGLGADLAQRVIDSKGNVLAEKLVDLLTEASGSANPAFALRVNYDLSVESLVINGKYDWKNDNITSANFPTARKGEADLVIELVHFNKVLTSEEVLKRLDKKGLRPAELHELLAFGEKYPDIQRRFPVIALGSLWLGFRGYRSVVPYLGRHGDERNLFLCGFFGSGWDEYCRFAAVRKSAETDK